MIASLALVLLITLSGTVATYAYDDHASVGARFCSGSCLGLAALGLVGFVVASFLGLTVATVALTALICSLPLVLLTESKRRAQFQNDLQRITLSLKRLVTQPDALTVGYFLFYAFIALVFWQVFNRAMIDDSEGISTGLLNNFGDLPFHLSVITGFAYGHNFPPDDPTYAGVRFTYPFLSDFVSAIFVTIGADLRQSMFIENIVLALAFVGLLHRWALVMLRDRLAAVLTPLLVLLNGGFGWVLLYDAAKKDEKGLSGILSNLPPSFTVIPETAWRWGNAISALLVPQRGFLMGLPLAVIVFTQWWLAVGDTESDQELSAVPPRTKKSSKHDRLTRKAEATAMPLSVRRMIAAGVAAGVLPLVHAHSFVVVMAMGGCLALLLKRWREWFAFFLTASLIALPQLWWSTSHSAVNAQSFFAWEFGWDRHDENPIWFWFKNTGLFIPLIVAAVLWRGKNYLVKKH